MAPVSDTAKPSETLRTHLRAATMVAHDLLDHAMQAASGWQQRQDYARFLALQHAARAPIEGWLKTHAPGDLCPPLQTPLIARDLAELGVAVPAPAPLFTLGRAAPGHALGTAWVLAGSALGNRAIAKAVARIGGGEWPVAFLGDGAMMSFWQELRARIERPAPPAEAAAATQAAEAVFAHFLAVAETGHAPDRTLESADA
ncbi:biliverdin-producing heme oxygenase [Erythrobacter donghaensis]|uniref:biliverdin-producing heme oxygenase n=1 Tax=Erythrobacter donghaensis TaxID=267135 RepID=UPI000A3BF726|nr:biliverdin-producing heme oxygenase [Erythrobacter donghaensis]